MVKRKEAFCQLLHHVFYNTNYTMGFLLLIWEYMDENPIAWYELDYLHSTMFSFRQCG